MIEYVCKGCGEAMESPDSMIGKMEVCPGCQRKNKVPTAEQVLAKAEKEAEKKRRAEEKKRQKALMLESQAKQEYLWQREEQERSQRQKISDAVDTVHLQDISLTVVATKKEEKEIIRWLIRQLNEKDAMSEPVRLQREPDTSRKKNIVKVSVWYAPENAYCSVGWICLDAGKDEDDDEDETGFLAECLDDGDAADVMGYPFDSGPDNVGVSLEGFLVSREVQEKYQRCKAEVLSQPHAVVSLEKIKGNLSKAAEERRERRAKPRTAAEKEAEKEAKQLAIRKGEIYDLKVTGVTKRNSLLESRQGLIKKCSGGMAVELVRKADNPHDGNAVKVCLTNGKQIGYVDAQKAATVAWLLDNGHIPNVVIGAILGSDESDTLGVRLRCTWPE